MSTRKRIEELYYVRAISALGIFIIHATGGFVVFSEYGSKAMYLGIFLNQFFRYGTPIFMMVSGLVLFYNYRNFNEFSSKKFFIKKLKYIFIPYTLWSCIYFLYNSYIYKVGITFEGLLKLLVNIIIGSTYSHLYFIVLIFQFYIMFPIMLKYLSKPMNNKPLRVFIFAAILQAIILFYEYRFEGKINTGFIGFVNRYYWKLFVGWFFYFITGGLLGLHYDAIVRFIDRNIRKIFIFYILALVGYIYPVYLNVITFKGRQYYDRFGSIRPNTMIYAILSMCIILWFARRMTKKDFLLKNITRNFGTYSLGIYFAHPIVLEFVKGYLMAYFPSYIGYSRMSSLIIVIGIGCILTAGLVFAVAFLNSRWLLIGKVPKLKGAKIEVCN